MKYERLEILTRKVWFFFQLVIALPIVLLCRLIRPIVLIRFGVLSSPRIGHFAANVEIYLCRRDAGEIPERTYDFFCHAPGISNSFLKRKWSQQIKITGFVRALHFANNLLPKAQEHIVPMTEIPSSIMKDHRIHLIFTDSEQIQAQYLLATLGISTERPIVCFHNRDDMYLNTTHTHRSWHYHDYRDSSVNDLLPTIDYLTSEGYTGIRMGAIVKEKIDSDNPHIIDYANNGRTDFLDIFIPSICDLFIGTTAGIMAIPKLFKKPIVYTNIVPIGVLNLLVCANDSVFIPKKLWITKENRFMTFSEIIKEGKRWLYETEEYERLGIQVIDNTPEEILSVTKEMELRMIGQWSPTQEDIELQKTFRHLLKPYDLAADIVTTIGADFLKNNQCLLK